MKKEHKEIINKYDKDYDSIYTHKYLLSENFIRKFKDEIDWSWVSICQTLSEDFIREFKDKVDWDYIYNHQN